MAITPVSSQNLCGYFWGIFLMLLSGALLLVSPVLAVYCATISEVKFGEVVVQAGSSNIFILQSGEKYSSLFSKVVVYKKSIQYSFEYDKAIGVMFNDGGRANISGSILYDLPDDECSMLKLHMAYGSQNAIEEMLIRSVVEKAVYMTGSLMSSFESYTGKRPEFLADTRDQVTGGMYALSVEDVTTENPITGIKTLSSVVKVATNEKGEKLRRESSILREFGINVSNFLISDITYSDQVDAMIKAKIEAMRQVSEAEKNCATRQDELVAMIKKSVEQAKAAELKPMKPHVSRILSDEEIERGNREMKESEKMFNQAFKKACTQKVKK